MYLSSPPYQGFNTRATSKIDIEIYQVMQKLICIQQLNASMQDINTRFPWFCVWFFTKEDKD